MLDVSGSMQAEDVKPTRLAAAQRAIHIFLDKVPGNVRVGLVLFAGTPIVATPPTTDHDLVGRAVDSAGDVNPFGGTAIGDALAAAVRLGRQVAGTAGGQQALGGARTLAAESKTALTHAPVSILFLSDGHQNRGDLQPLQGAARAKAAGFPVYTVALGTTGNTTLRGRPTNGGFFFGGSSGGFGNGLAPDPKTLRAIAVATGGEFFRAKTAGDVRGRVREARRKPRPVARTGGGDRGLRRGSRHPPAARRARLDGLGAAAALGLEKRAQRVLWRRRQQGRHARGAAGRSRAREAARTQRGDPPWCRRGRP